MLPRTCSTSSAPGACAAAAAAKAARTMTTRVTCLISILITASSGGARRRTPFCPIRLPAEMHGPDKRLRPILGVINHRRDAQILLALEPGDHLEVFGQNRPPAVGNPVLIEVAGPKPRRHDAQLTGAGRGLRLSALGPRAFHLPARERKALP